MADSLLSISAANSNGEALKKFQITTDVSSKKDYMYGKNVAQSIYSTIYGNQTYFWLRNNRFRKNRQIANGKIDMSVFMDRLEMNSKANFVNINWKSIIIGNTIVARLVGSWMSRSEKVTVTATDSASAMLKKNAADEAEFVYQNKEVLSQLQQESGVQIIPQDQFVAEDKDELDQWISEFNHLPESVAIRKLADFSESIKSLSKDSIIKLYPTSKQGVVFLPYDLGTVENININEDGYTIQNEKKDNIYLVDTIGVIHTERQDLNQYKKVYSILLLMNDELKLLDKSTAAFTVLDTYYSFKKNYKQRKINLNNVDTN